MVASRGGGLLRSLLLRGWWAAPQVVASRVTGRNVRSIFTLIVIFLAQPALGSQASVPGCFFCANDLCLLAFSFWHPAQRLLRICCIAASSVHLLHCSGFCASAASQRLLRICCIAAASAHLLHRNGFCASAASQRLLRICCIAAASVHLLHRSVFCTSAALQRLLRICCIAAASVHLLHCSVFCGAASSSVQTSASLHPSRSASASNIFPMALRRSASILFTMALPASSSATAPRPATNLIRRRKVLRFG